MTEPLFPNPVAHRGLHDRASGIIENSASAFEAAIIAGFAIDQTTGIARFIGTTPCGGRVPRDFAFDPSGQVLVVANQESDVLSLFRYQPDTGALAPLGQPIPSGSPTAIAFHPTLR